MVKLEAKEKGGSDLNKVVRAWTEGVWAVCDN